MPDRYNKVFLVDQPGIGGLEITEADYLARFGPGKFNIELVHLNKVSRSLQLYSHAWRQRF